jgi:hypothetical protein
MLGRPVRPQRGDRGTLTSPERSRDRRGLVADVTFDREHVLDLGGVLVRMTMVVPTHTKGTPSS